MTKTVQGRFLIPATDEARVLILGVIARALAMYPAIELYAFTFLSNHYHLLAAARDGRSMSRFINYLNSNVALEMSRLTGWSGPFWAKRATTTAIVDDDALLQRLHYVMSQGVKEGLVSEVLEWTGASSSPGLLGDLTLSGVWINRDRETRANKRQRSGEPRTFREKLTITLSPLPQWRHLDAATRRGRYEEVAASIEARAAATRTKPPLGMAEVRRWTTEDRAPEIERTPQPLCHASTKASRGTFRAAFRAYVDQFRKAAKALAETVMPHLSEFPRNCFPRPMAFTRDPADPATPPPSVPGASTSQWPSGEPPRPGQRGPRIAPARCLVA